VLNLSSDLFNPNYKPVTKAAMGGVITEQIQGVGKETGKRYSFGEQGDEAIIPINQFYEMAARLKRIGAGGMIPSALQNEGVGLFTGVSKFGLNRALDKYNTARDEKEENMGALQEQLDRLTASHQALNARRAGWSSGSRSSRRNVMARMIRRDKNRRLTDLMAPIQAEISALMGGEESARTEFGDLFSQAGGTTTNEGSTWNNNISISVNDASGNIDNIIQKIGPKLLKYLQENEARIGIR